jgi:hypothetical protein
MDAVDTLLPTRGTSNVKSDRYVRRERIAVSRRLMSTFRVCVCVCVCVCVRERENEREKERESERDRS